MRAFLNAEWDRIDADAERHKDSPSALLRLERLYRSFDDDDRREADTVLTEWVAGINARKRFDALALIDEFHIVDALPSLRRLATMLEESDDPLAPYEWQKVNGIISRLAVSRS